MSKQSLNIGSVPNDGTGDTIREASTKTNENFTEIYNTFGDGSTLSGIVTTAQGLTGIPNIQVGVVTATGFISQSSVDQQPLIITHSGLVLTLAVPGKGAVNLTLQ